MKISKNYALRGVAALVFLALLSWTCKKETKTPDPDPDPPQAVATVTPQPFPGTATTGIQFPEDTVLIYEWLNSYDTAAIAAHAWGIWSGLTKETGEVYNKDRLRVFETWMGVADLKAIMEQGGSVPSCDSMTKTGRTRLEPPNQFHHAAVLTALATGTEAVDTNALNNLWVTVAYSPPAACFALNNTIFSTAVLDKYVPTDPNGFGDIPKFPADAITIKPTYLTAHNNGKDLIALPVWPGQPAPARNIPGFDAYWQFVFADPTNSQPNDKVPVPASSDEASGEELQNATVNLQDFIHFAVDSAMAAYINQQQSAVQGVDAQAGDLAILMGMHVATKEISNWTWQTFFWTPDPANPPFPSSSFIYQNRSSATQLTPAAAHYAAVPVYNMVWPNQPISGGTNAGATAHIGYNPYLEPGLGQIDNIPNQLDPNFKWGVQSNCMTCHSLASYKPAGKGGIGYSADQYLGMDNAIFAGYARLDFAWSINQAKFTPK